MAERTTDLRTVSHRRLVTRTLVKALRNVFGSGYNRDRQFVNLKVTSEFPEKQEEFPCVVVEYIPTRNSNAGVGHEEWFMDQNNILRKWHHRRFEGSVSFHCFALKTLDRDVIADAVEEILAYGRLDAALLPFFNTIYGDPNDPNVEFVFSQLMLNVDVIDLENGGQSIAPWAPEDEFVYDSSLTVEIHGGLYNVNPSDTWDYVTSVDAQPYPQFEENVTLPFNDPSLPWTNPFEYEDDGIVTGIAVISAVESSP